MQRYMLSVLASCALLGMAAVTLLAIRSDRAMRTLFEADPPSPILRRPQETGIRGLQAIVFTSRTGIVIAGWYVRPRETRGPAIVVAHGTNSDRSTMLTEMKLLADAGYGVLAFDWPGLGESEGAVRWDGQAREVLGDAIDWLSARPEVNPRRIGGLGFSIGGFVMTQEAGSDSRLRAIVLESTPPDFDEYIQLHGSKWGWISKLPARWAIEGSGLLDEDVSPVNVIAKISPRPVLLVGMTHDPEVSAAMVRKLFVAARDPKRLWIIQGATHGGYASADREYGAKITAFFAENLRPAS